MKTLYVSDLDGTLLDKDAQISEFTIQTINELQKKGLDFTVATARSAATVLKIIEDLNLKSPVILLNGVCIYDVIARKYVKIEKISRDAVYGILDVIKKYDLAGFIYEIDCEELSTYYQRANSSHAAAFIEERQRKYNKRFTKVDDLMQCIDKNIVYYSISDKKENLLSAYNEFLEIESINIEFYRDVYLEDYYYLEISSDKASKYNAIKFLREEYGYEKIIGFGDNLNDIPLFAACDEAYAVSNAKAEVKEKATAIIDSNINDGVARWLMENFKF